MSTMTLRIGECIFPERYAFSQLRRYLLAINTSGEVGRIGALTNTTASEKEWLILTSMSDFSCFPGLTGNTRGDYNASHSWSPARYL